MASMQDKADWINVHAISDILVHIYALQYT